MLANDLPNELSTQRLWQIRWMKAYNYDKLNKWKHKQNNKTTMIRLMIEIMNEIIKQLW